MLHADRDDCHRENPVASCYPLNADPAGICRAGVHHDPAADLTSWRVHAGIAASGKLVLRHHRRKLASVRTGVFTVSGGSQLSVFSLCHYADDRTVYGTTPSASAGVSGGDDGTGLSVYLCADGVGFADSERTGMPPGVWLVKDQLLLHGTADLQSVPAGIPAGRPYLYGNGVQRVHR